MAAPATSTAWPLFTSPRKEEGGAKRRVGGDGLNLRIPTPTLPLSGGGRWALAGLLLTLSPTVAQACQIESDYKVSPWETQIDKAPVVFIGHVAAIEPNEKPGGWPDRVFFNVETPVSGRLGQSYETTQAADGNCGITFRVGDWVIFAGEYELDPTVFLSEPLTKDQRMKLGYLKRMLSRTQTAVEGAGK